MQQTVRRSGFGVSRRLEEALLRTSKARTLRLHRSCNQQVRSAVLPRYRLEAYATLIRSPPSALVGTDLTFPDLDVRPALPCDAGRARPYRLTRPRSSASGCSA